MPIAHSTAVRTALALAVLAGCAPGRSTPLLVPAPMPPQDSIELALFLVGDAGSPRYDEEPVLRALARAQAAARPAQRFVVFLGDNVYPRGVPPLDHPRREDAEKRLLAQVRAVGTDGAQGLLVPGNHDWDRQGPEGWAAIRRQDSLVREFGGGYVRLRPGGGCPGPYVVDLATSIRIIAVDTQWWLHKARKPYGADSPCAARTPGELMDSLAGALRDAAQRHAIVVTHHPLRTGGVHGGTFTLMDHLFPLRNLESWLWVPLPVIGSIYPLARQLGISSQDLSGKKYRAMRLAFERAFEAHPPLVIASGHDHDLQVIRGARPEITHAGFQLVSGAGYVGHESLVRRIEGSLFRHDGAGFMRLDVTRDGRVRLGVHAVDADPEREATTTEIFSLWLTDQPRVH